MLPWLPVAIGVSAIVARYDSDIAGTVCVIFLCLALLTFVCGLVFLLLAAIRRSWQVTSIVAVIWLTLCFLTRGFAPHSIEIYLHDELVERRAAIIESEKWEFPQYAEEHRQLPWHPRIEFKWIVSPVPGLVLTRYDTLESYPNCDMGRITLFSWYGRRFHIVWDTIRWIS
jgi:hypothetical protein